MAAHGGLASEERVFGLGSGVWTGGARAAREALRWPPSRSAKRAADWAEKNPQCREAWGFWGRALQPDGRKAQITWQRDGGR